MIANKRLYGAASFLGQLKSKNIHDSVVSYSMKAFVVDFLQADGNCAIERLVVSLSEQMAEDEKKIKALIVDKSDNDAKYIFTQCCDSLRDIQLPLPALVFKLFVATANGPEFKRLLSDYLLSSDELLNCIDNHFESLLSEADAKTLRAMLSTLEGRNCSDFKIILLEQLMSQIQAPYWEHYNLASEFSTLEQHSDALSHYGQFFEQAISRDEQNPIKHGLVGILRSLFYVPDQLSEHKVYYDKAPSLVQQDKDVQVLIKELALISDCQTALKQKRVVDEKIAGYQYINKSLIQEHINTLTQATSVTPSHHSFYELFKLNAMANNKEMAKELLKNAYQANTLILSVG